MPGGLSARAVARLRAALPVRRRLGGAPHGLPGLRLRRPGQRTPGRAARGQGRRAPGGRQDAPSARRQPRAALPARHQPGRGPARRGPHSGPVHLLRGEHPDLHLRHQPHGRTCQARVPRLARHGCQDHGGRLGAERVAPRPGLGHGPGPARPVAPGGQGGAPAPVPGGRQLSRAPGRRGQPGPAARARGCRRRVERGGLPPGGLPTRPSSRPRTPRAART